MNNDLFTVDLDNAEKRDTLFFSSLFKSVTCIPLETTDNSLIGGIHKMLVYKNHIYILEKRYTQVLFVFDKQGNFIRKIGNRGGGTGEYYQIHDFTINPDNDEIIIVADYKILFFDHLTGVYKNTVALQNRIAISNIQYFNDILYTDLREYSESSEGYLMQSINLSTGEQEAKFLKANEYNKGYNEFIATEADRFTPTIEQPPYLFRQLFMDTFFALTTKGVQPYLTIKSKDFVTKNEIERFDRIHPDFIYGTNTIFVLYSYFSHNNYIHFMFRRMINEKNKIYSVLYDTKSNTTQIFDNCRNDLLYKRGLMFSKFAFFDKSGVYEYISPFAMSSFLNIIKENGINDTIKDQLKGLNEESNPVIFFYEFK